MLALTLAPLRYTVLPVAIAFGIWWLAWGILIFKRKRVSLLAALLFISGNAVLCAIFRHNFVSIADRLCLPHPFW
jgi:hypothetical protein